MNAKAAQPSGGLDTESDPLAVPMQLPRRRYGSRHRLEVLSASSLRAFEKCPEAFRRRYLLGEKEPRNLSMTLGSVVGDAVAHHFQWQIDGSPRSSIEIDDLTIELFDAKLAETALADDDDPDRGLQQCREGVADYLDQVAPTIVPISVERRASFRFPRRPEWRFECYFDVECADQVPDVKFGKSTVSEARAARDLQATAEAFMRWAEGSPAEFVFHSGVLEVGDGPRWTVVPAPRSPAQLLGFQARVARVARQIVHLDRTEPGTWPLSSDFGWWCAPREGTDGCPYWQSCPVGSAAAAPPG